MMQTQSQNKVGAHNKRLLSVYDAGEYLSVSHWTIRDLVNKGVLPYVRIGRRLLIDIKDLNIYVESLKDRVV